MSRGPDASTQVERALLASADGAGCPIKLATSNTQRWASATFVGAQHMLTVNARASPNLDAWLAALPEDEFSLRGHLVADCTVQCLARDGDAVTATLEILTIEER